MAVLVVGQRLSHDAPTLRMALERARIEAEFVPNAASAAEVLLTQTPRCVLADAQADVRDLNRALRARAECFGVPLIAVTDQCSERMLLELHRLGSDDVVATHDVGGLTRRLAALSTFDPRARTALFQGTCLLGEPDPYRRQVLGRVLRQAGFDVSFAADSSEAMQVAERMPPKVIIVSDRLPPHGGLDALHQLSTHWVGSMPAVLLSSLTMEARLSQPITTDFPTVQQDAPPDDLLFVVNELLRPRELVESRASRRILYATLCTFRAEGDFEPRPGLTYNISREGLYVRTFDAPPTPTKAWLELRPPASRDVVHLRGDIVWSRALTTGAHGATPPGFGVKLTLDEAPPKDRELYVRHYELLKEHTP